MQPNGDPLEDVTVSPPTFANQKLTMKELADRIKESRIPMDNFEEIASHQIKEFITEKEASWSI